MPNKDDSKNSTTAPANSEEQQAAAAATSTGTETTPAGDDEDDEEEGEPAAKTPIQLTSKQLNARLERATKKERSELFAKLGVTDEAAALKLIADAKQAETEKLSEAERLKVERDAALEKADRAEAVLREQARIREEAEAREGLEKILKKAGVSDDAMDLAVAQASKYIEKNFEDDDKVSTKTLKPFLTDLQEKKKLWFEAETVPAGQAGETAPPAGKTRTAQTTSAAFDPAEMISDPFKWAEYKRKRGLTHY